MNPQPFIDYLVVVRGVSLVIATCLFFVLIVLFWQKIDDDRRNSGGGD